MASITAKILVSIFLVRIRYLKENLEGLRRVLEVAKSRLERSGQTPKGWIAGTSN